jgi:subtilisin family serine protease
LSAQALQWAVDNGIKITNNSYGRSGDSGTLVTAVSDSSYAAGVLHTVSAGNSGRVRGDSTLRTMSSLPMPAVGMVATHQRDAFAAVVTNNVKNLREPVDITERLY